ncbi:hypothetical protein BN135_644 [Cronobacter muytjensii 530]
MWNRIRIRASGKRSIGGEIRNGLFAQWILNIMSFFGVFIEKLNVSRKKA